MTELEDRSSPPAGLGLDCRTEHSVVRENLYGSRSPGVFSGHHTVVLLCAAQAVAQLSSLLLGDIRSIRSVY
jgi:hypothetical protein